MTWEIEVELSRLEAARRPWVEYPFPLREDGHICKLVLPRDLSKLEAVRLIGFINSLVVPESPE